MHKVPIFTNSSFQLVERLILAELVSREVGFIDLDLKSVEIPPFSLVFEAEKIFIVSVQSVFDGFAAKFFFVDKG